MAVPVAPMSPVRTQLQLAEIAGVSQVTVHKALANQPGVSDVVRRRIRSLADQYGYRPNAGAKAMRRGSFGCVALVLGQSPVKSLLPPQLLNGVQRALAALDQHLILSTLPDEKLTSDGFVPKILREVMADGLLINYNARIPQAMFDLIRRHEIPSIWLNSKQPHDSVRSDDAQGAQMAVQQLIAKGHRRILYLDYTPSPDGTAWHYSAADRWAGYSRAMLRAGLHPERLGNDVDWGNGLAVSQIRAKLSRGNPLFPTAVLAYSGREMRAVLLSAMAEGLTVGRDLSVACFAADPLAEAGIPIACVLLPELAISERAVAMVMEKIRRPNIELPSVAVPCEWRAGQTVNDISTV